MHTIVLMLMLADLAEQAAGVSREIRAYVLWILRPAEAVGWYYAFGTDSDDLTDFDLLAICLGGGNSPKDALALAASFRAIAAALQQIMMQYKLIGLAVGGCPEQDRNVSPDTIRVHSEPAMQRLSTREAPMVPRAVKLPRSAPIRAILDTS